MNTFTSCMKDHGFATMRRYVRKSSSITLNEALFRSNPFFVFYFFLIENKEWNHPMIIDLWLINLFFIFFLDYHHDHVHI
jgi:hypothetical protein